MHLEQQQDKGEKYQHKAKSSWVTFTQIQNF